MEGKTLPFPFHPFWRKSQNPAKCKSCGIHNHELSQKKMPAEPKDELICERERQLGAGG